MKIRDSLAARTYARAPATQQPRPPAARAYAQGVNESFRGILYPTRLPEFRRVPPPAECAHLVRWFWISRWSLAPGRVSRQQIVGYPASNLVVERTVVGISGPTTVASHKDLIGRGWAVGALLRPPAVPDLVGDPADVLDDYRTSPVEDPAYADLHARVALFMDDDDNTDHAAADAHAAAESASWILDRVGPPSEDALLADQLSVLADSRPDLTTVPALAAELGVSVRTSQRLARRFIGVSPAAMIRRRRLQEAADRVRSDPDSDLAGIAHDLGYADHAHLCADFRRVLGFTPAQYRDDAAG